MSQKKKKYVDKRKRMIQIISVVLVVVMAVLAVVSSYYMITG